MLDWAIVAKRFGELITLDPPKRAELLAAMQKGDPEATAFLRHQCERQGLDTDFMATTAAADAGAQEASLEPGARIGAWVIEELLGSGGMGNVYRARRDDGTFEQTAAIKLSRLADAQLRARLEAERQRLARLEHPNIARIIDGGADAGGHPYMVVEFVEGQEIDAWCAAQGRTLDDKLAVIGQLCDALSHAHARLVLHRDIKPGNVLVNDAGQVRLIDFGIAEAIDVGQAAQPGPLTLTIAAPEQLRGDAPTVATDIFQTGMLVHRLIAGSWPVRRSDGGVAVTQGAFASRDLLAIVEKALRSDPEARYESIDALGSDLTAYREGLPVSAREGGAVYRVTTFVKRYRAASSLAALAVVALAGGLAASLVYAEKARAENERYRISEIMGGQLESYRSAQTRGAEDFLYSLDEAAIDDHIAQLRQYERRITAARDDDPQLAAAAYVYLLDQYYAINLNEDMVRIAAQFEALDLPDSFNRAYFLMDASFALIATGDYDGARDYLDTARSFFAQQPSVNAYELVMVDCISGRIETGNAAKAACHKGALDVITSSDHLTQQATNSTLTMLAYASEYTTELGDYGEGLQLIAEARSIINTLDEEPTVPEAAFALNEARIYIAMDQIADSARVLEVELAKDDPYVNSPVFQSIFRNQLAQNLLDLDRVEEAREQAARALPLTISASGENGEGAATSYRILAIAHDRLGDEALALEYVEKALPRHAGGFGDQKQYEDLLAMQERLRGG